VLDNRLSLLANLKTEGLDRLSLKKSVAEIARQQ